MKRPLLLLTLFTALLLAPLAALHAADAPSLHSPQHLGAPRAEHAVTNRAFTGIPSMAVAPKGRLWATWYAGVTPAEDVNNYVVLSTSGDGGATWSEVLVVDPDGSGPLRSFDSQLWVSPDGRLFLLWAELEPGRYYRGVWCIETAEPDAANPKWSVPRRIGENVMMGKPLVLSSGEWVLPISLWAACDKSAQFVVSTDAAKTWQVRGGCNVPKDARSFDEHLFIERKDGSLWLLARTKYGIGESLSTDRGVTWPELAPSPIPHPDARFFITRLASGNLLLVKHGPLDKQTSRSQLIAYLSKDDGRTWIGGLMLDKRFGVSYPDGQQTPDGLIRIIYDYDRMFARNIFMATFSEKDVAAGKDVSGAVKLRQLVSKATGGQEIANANADGKPLRKTKTGTLTSEGLEPQPFVPGAKLFSDRAYIANEVPNMFFSSFKAAHFLPIAMSGKKTITCQRAGTVYFLTPLPERNRDTQSQELMNHGLEKVTLFEVRLFGLSYTDLCTLYQKDCAAGETILIGTWAVPVFFP